MITGPSTLFPILRTIETLWKIEHRNEAAEKIVAAAEGVHKKFVAFRADMEKIERGLASAQNAYEGAVNKLSNGRGNLTDSMKRLSDPRLIGGDDAPQILEAVVESEEEESPPAA